MTRCPSCIDQRVISFNWKSTVAGNNKKFAQFIDAFKEGRSLRYGTLYSCPTCHQRWYLDQEGSCMSKIPHDRVALIELWNSEALTVSDAHRHILKKIGGTPPDRYGNGRGTLQFPCKITSIKGTSYDPAIIYLCSWPPYSSHLKNIHLLSDIRTVEESDYALNRSIRYRTTRAQEVRMCFCPTPVKAKDGKKFILEGTTNVFFYENYKGNDIEFDLEKVKENFRTYTTQDYSKIYYFWGDYPERADELTLTEIDV